MEEDKIYEQITKGVRKPTKHKVAMISCGASGSGKTTSRSKFVDDFGMKSTFVMLNLDDYWKYRSTPAQTRELYKSLVTRTISDGYSFFFDGTCRYTPSILTMIRDLKEKGYHVVLSITFAKLKTVLDRLKRRTEQPIEKHYAIKIYQEVSRRIEDLMKEPSIDEVYLYDNDVSTRLVYKRKGETITCISPESNFYFKISEFC